MNFIFIYFLGFILNVHDMKPCTEENLASNVKNTEFIAFNKIDKSIDWAIRYLRKNNNLYVTDEKHLYNSTDIRDSKTPNSLLLFGGKSNNLIIIAFEKGGYFPQKNFFVLKKCNRKIFVKELFFKNKEILTVRDLTNNL